jgi:hypothetical protein
VNQVTLNSCYSTRAMRRRYEVWFLKLLLADNRGAWWFRYLLTNPGKRAGGGCPADLAGLADQRRQPVQLWATWFPRDAPPQNFVQGFPLDELQLSEPGQPLALQLGPQLLSHDACRGKMEIEGQTIAWDLQYRSTAGASLSDVGWVGFSRTPHSDAVFTGEISFNSQTFRSAAPDAPLGYGLQGHNCGFRHRNQWTWMHCFVRNESGAASTFEALEYEVGFGFHFRRALLWHQGRLYTLKKFTNHLRDRPRMLWHFQAADARTKVSVTAEIDGNGTSLHRLPYLKTDCSGTFEVANNSLAQAVLTIRHGHQTERLYANAGAVLEMVGG